MMESNEIIEGNKLIANSPFSHPRMRENIAKDLAEGRSEDYVYSDKRYHSDWSWIMPVVAEIKKGKHDGNQMFMGTTWERDIQYRSVTDLPIYTPIESVWQKVVAFINWYNSAQQANGKMGMR